jgi:hypothetical protein
LPLLCLVDRLLQRFQLVVGNVFGQAEQRRGRVGRRSVEEGRTICFSADSRTIAGRGTLL